jgi:hypothetical protein
MALLLLFLGLELGTGLELSSQMNITGSGKIFAAYDLGNESSYVEVSAAPPGVIGYMQTFDNSSVVINMTRESPQQMVFTVKSFPQPKPIEANFSRPDMIP